jgi:hypothetical protein
MLLFVCHLIRRTFSHTHKLLLQHGKAILEQLLFSIALLQTGSGRKLKSARKTCSSHERRADGMLTRLTSKKSNQRAMFAAP